MTPEEFWTLTPLEWELHVELIHKEHRRQLENHLHVVATLLNLRATESGKLPDKWQTAAGLIANG